MKIAQWMILAMLILTGTACNNQTEITSSDSDLVSNEQNPASSQTVGFHDTMVEVTSVHDHEENLHLFEMSASEIASGWTTFRFQNSSHTDHFFLIYQVPEEAIEAAEQAGEPLLDHWFQGVTKPFQEEFNPYVRGDIDYGTFVDNLVGSIFEKGPWFFDPGAPPMGGPGFTSAGFTSETTVHLEPGEYIVECYVKDENEIFHSYRGMLDQLTVTEEINRRPDPKGSIKLTISSERGFELNRPMSPGNQTVEIHFEDQDSYAHLLGHNVQLVRLADKDDEELLRELADWMDWRMPGSLVFRAPEGVEMLGGSMEMTAGSTAFYHVNLEPGDYAWIAEIPDPDAHNMLKTFRIPRGHSNAR